MAPSCPVDRTRHLLVASLALTLLGGAACRTLSQDQCSYTYEQWLELAAPSGCDPAAQPALCCGPLTAVGPCLAQMHKYAMGMGNPASLQAMEALYTLCGVPIPSAPSLAPISDPAAPAPAPCGGGAAPLLGASPPPGSAYGEAGRSAEADSDYAMDDACPGAFYAAVETACSGEQGDPTQACCPAVAAVGTTCLADMLATMMMAGGTGSEEVASFTQDYIIGCDIALPAGPGATVDEEQCYLAYNAAAEEPSCYSGDKTVCCSGLADLGRTCLHRVLGSYNSRGLTDSYDKLFGGITSCQIPLFGPQPADPDTLCT